MPREPHADDPAPPLWLRWGEISELWVWLRLSPRASTLRIRQLVDEMFADQFGDSLTLEDVMSMFDNDPNFEEHFTAGDRFVLTGLRYIGEISTVKGPAHKVLADIVTRESYPNVVTFSALGVGFANMAQRATKQDFPVVVEYARVRRPGGNEIKRWLKVEVSPADWRSGEDGPAVEIPHDDGDGGGGPVAATGKVAQF